MQASPVKTPLKTPLQGPTLLRRIFAALAVLSPRPLCSLVDSPLPELREVGHEWRAS
jgi:hypothetical protein